MKFSNRTKKIGTGILSILLSASCLTACGGGGGGGGNNPGGGSKAVTEIQFLNYQGCSGNEWVEAAAKRFAELKANESYETGKKGVRISVSETKAIPYYTLNSDGYDIYIGENKANIYEMASQGFLLDLGEVVEGIENKIDPDAIKRIKGADGKYYGLPAYEWYTGVSYDYDYFTEANLFFAAPEAKGRKVTNKFGSIKLVNSQSDKKSCGPDGVYNTEDDGMPSSVQEFLTLLAEIKSDGRSPFILSGNSIDYGFMLADGLWASLSGKEQFKTIYSLDSNGKKIVEVVTGYTDEDLFYNGSGIKRPTTEMIAIDEENGYKIYDMASRYYALATLQLIYNEKWFLESFLNNAQKTNVQAQYNFVNEGEAAILYDSSFWCGESVRSGDFEAFKALNPDKSGRDVRYMPLPVTLETSVSENNGKRQALVDGGAAQLFVNKRVANNEGKKRAVIEFLQFLYSDAELAAFTESTGLKVPVEYNYDGSKLNSYFEHLTKYVEESDVVYFASDSTIVKKNLEAFSLTWSSSVHRPVLDGIEIAKGYIEAMKNKGADAKTIFEVTKKNAESWANLQK